jgi:tetratricopeptide (TPR) repeat protein
LLAYLGAPPENYYNAANRLFLAGDFHRAEAFYARAGTILVPPVRRALGQKSAPSDLQFKALYNAGNAAYLQAHWLQAVSNYQAALRLDPSDEDAWNNLGLAQAQLKGKSAAAAGPGRQFKPIRSEEPPTPVDIFSLPPGKLADYLQDLTRAGYPFRPGSSLKPPPTPTGQNEEVDW